MTIDSTLKERITAGAQWSPGFNQKPIPPRLAALAQFIRETWPNLKVTLTPWDRKGNRLTVQDTALDPQGYGYHGVLLCHDSGDRERHNGEVCQWIVDRMILKDAK